MTGHHYRRRPVWQRGKLSRLTDSLRELLKQITLRRVLLTVIGLPLLLYVYREVTRDTLIIDPFTVPRSFEEAGLTSEVVANRIGDAVRQIEINTVTQMKKDDLDALSDDGSTPNVEIPGTNLGLKTVVELTRAIFGIYPKHVSGDIVVDTSRPVTTGSRATVTAYITQGRNRGQANSISATLTDTGSLDQSTAEMILGQVNPYILAAYLEGRGEYKEAVEALQRIIRTQPADRYLTGAAYNLWGLVLYDQKKYGEAVDKYQKAIELYPKLAIAYSNWGLALADQQRYDEAISEYRKAVELNPKSADVYTNWGFVLDDQKHYDEAVAKYRKAIELDPTDTDTYNDWGFVLAEQKKYDEAAAKYRKAIEFDPKNADAYVNWGALLVDQKKYDQAGAKYQKATEVDPKEKYAYTSWGDVLAELKKYDEAGSKYQKAIELDPTDAQAYIGWGVVMAAQEKYEDAASKYRKAIELDPKNADTYAKWGTVLTRQKKYDQAEKQFAKARELSSSSMNFVSQRH